MIYGSTALSFKCFCQGFVRQIILEIELKFLGNIFYGNILFFGVTHSALSATRVMGTCATIGQAVGTAAWIAVIHKLLSHEVYQNKLEPLKQTLMKDDCYLPGNKMKL